MSAAVDLPGKLSLHRDLAASVQAGFEGVSDTSYPGVRSPLPPIYLFAVRALLARHITDAFGLASRAMAREFGYFSLVTTPISRWRRPGWARR